MLRDKKPLKLYKTLLLASDAFRERTCSKGENEKKKNQQKLELNRAGRPEGGSYTL